MIRIFCVDNDRSARHVASPGVSRSLLVGGAAVVVVVVVELKGRVVGALALLCFLLINIPVWYLVDL